MTNPLGADNDLLVYAEAVDLGDGTGYYRVLRKDTGALVATVNKDEPRPIDQTRAFVDQVNEKGFDAEWDPPGGG